MLNQNPKLKVIVNTRTVSQLDGMTGYLQDVVRVKNAGNMGAVLLNGYHSPMLFHEDEIVRAAEVEG